MEVQNRVFIIVAATLLWTSCVPADSINEQPLPPTIQNIDVGKSSSDPIDEDHYNGPSVMDDATAVMDDATADVDDVHADVDGLHVFTDDDSNSDDEEDVDSTAFPQLSFASSSSSSSLTSSSSSLTSSSSSSSSSSLASTANSVYDFVMKGLDGNDVSLSVYKGRVLLIVNYANFCGLTIPNVQHLSKMATEYGPSGLTILMFPSNSFFQNWGGEISGMSLKRSHPEFEVFSMISVHGNSESSLYTYLRTSTPGNRHLTKSIKWNFTKFLIDQNGHPVARYNPLTHFKLIEAGVKGLLEPPQTNN